MLHMSESILGYVMIQLPVVNIRCGERYAIGILDVEIGFNTGGRLRVQASIYKHNTEGSANSVRAERLVESLNRHRIRSQK